MDKFYGENYPKDEKPPWVQVYPCSQSPTGGNSIAWAIVWELQMFLFYPAYLAPEPLPLKGSRLSKKVVV